MLSHVDIPDTRVGLDVSLWSADLGALAFEVRRLERYADLFHLDASDTRFVPEPLFSPATVAALRPHTSVPLHVHLMASPAAALAVRYADAGADLITVHVEAEDRDEAIARIRQRGKAAGLAVRLGTDPCEVIGHLGGVDAIVMIGTPLGTRGSSMDSEAPARLHRLRRALAACGRPKLPVFADGGIRPETAADLVAAGADVLVAGSILLDSADLDAMTRQLHTLDTCRDRPSVPALEESLRSGLEGWVVSVDLWGTLITYGDRAAEAQWRIREFTTVLAELGHQVPSHEVEQAVTQVRHDTRARQRASGAQPTPREQIDEIVAALGIEDDRLADVLLVAHSHAVLRACPEVIPGARDALRELKAAGARLVLTSNTLATPAEVTKLILDDHELSGFFDDMVFSSDLGVAKPRPEVFRAVADRNNTPAHKVIHVGNSLTTDVQGAFGAGCHAVWFNPRGKLGTTPAQQISHMSRMPAAVRTVAAAAVNGGHTGQAGA